MDAPGEQLLAGARLAEEEHRRTPGRRYALRELERSAQYRAFANDILKAEHAFGGWSLRDAGVGGVQLDLMGLGETGQAPPGERGFSYKYRVESPRVNCCDTWPTH
jgi:hypothetical protein